MNSEIDSSVAKGLEDSSLNDLALPSIVSFNEMDDLKNSKLGRSQYLNKENAFVIKLSYKHTYLI